MCPTTGSDSLPQDNKLKAAVGFLSLATVALLVSTIVLAVKGNQTTTTSSEASAANANDYSSNKASSNFVSSDDANVCAGAQLVFENEPCANFEVPHPQAGGNVTKGAFRLHLARSRNTISFLLSMHYTTSAPFQGMLETWWSMLCRIPNRFIKAPCVR
ncbi:hypothetical protein ACHAW6_000812 [Cyclotella cf. meneghiniana]